jgi:hypothetical protein
LQEWTLLLKIKNKNKIFHIFFFHKSLRKNEPISHITATPFKLISRLFDLLIIHTLNNRPFPINYMVLKFSKYMPKMLILFAQLLELYLIAIYCLYHSLNTFFSSVLVYSRKLIKILIYWIDQDNPLPEFLSTSSSVPIF